MHFAFTDDQRLFQSAVCDLLADECPPDAVRAAWESDGPGRSDGRWAKLAEMGVLGLTTPEAHGGLGMDEVDLVLLIEEAGRVCLPEPIVETVAVAAPLLADLSAGSGGAAAAEWLPRVVSGDAVIAVGFERDLYVSEGATAGLLLLERDGELHAVPWADAGVVSQHSVDRARRIARVEWSPSADTLLATGGEARTALDAAFDRAVLGVSAMLLGVTQHLLDVTVEYATAREQFGQPIGGFQAVKHHLADTKLRLEFARPMVYRAAWTVARGSDPVERATHVSMAKSYAAEAAAHAAETSLQVHGAIGYTFEYDLHLWMKRAWALNAQWGDAAWHRRRVAATLL